MKDDGGFGDVNDFVWCGSLKRKEKKMYIDTGNDKITIKDDEIIGYTEHLDSGTRVLIIYLKNYKITLREGVYIKEIAGWYSKAIFSLIDVINEN